MEVTVFGGYSDKWPLLSQGEKYSGLENMIPLNVSSLHNILNSTESGSRCTETIPYQCYRHSIALVCPVVHVIDMSFSGDKTEVSSLEKRIANWLVSNGELNLEHLVEAGLATAAGRRGEYTVTLSSNVQPSAAPFTEPERVFSNVSDSEARHAPTAFMTLLFDALWNLPAHDDSGRANSTMFTIGGKAVKAPPLEIAAVQCTLIEKRDSHEGSAALSTAVHRPHATGPSRGAEGGGCVYRKSPLRRH